MKVKEFLQLTDDKELKKVQQLKKVIVAKNEIGKKKVNAITKLKYSKVNKVRGYLLSDDLLSAFCELLECNQVWLLKQDYKEFLYFLKWVTKEFENISVLEAQLSKKEPEEEMTDMKLQMCGVDRLEVFEEINVIDSLAGGDVLKWESIEQLPYEVVYTKLLKNKIDASIQRRYQQLVSEEGKVK